MATDPYEDEEDPEREIYIREAADLLMRRMGTLRKWDQTGELPPELRPHRSKQRGGKWRYWTPAQIEGIREWMRDTDRRPGKGLSTYKRPTEEELDIIIEKMRRPHTYKRRRLEDI